MTIIKCIFPNTCTIWQIYCLNSFILLKCITCDKTCRIIKIYNFNSSFCNFFLCKSCHTLWNINHYPTITINTLTRIICSICRYIQCLCDKLRSRNIYCNHSTIKLTCDIITTITYICL